MITNGLVPVYVCGCVGGGCILNASVCAGVCVCGRWCVIKSSPECCKLRCANASRHVCMLLSKSIRVL